MIEILSQHKIFVIAAAVAFAIGAWYVLSGGSQATQSSTLLLTTTPQENTAGQDVVEVLLKLRSIKLDGVVFGEPAFRALQDFSTTIVLEPVGRLNPFAPLTRSVQPTAASIKAASIFSKKTPTNSVQSGGH